HNPNPKKGLKCKCDFKDLSKICNYCNENCERPFTRIDKDPIISGPFLFAFDESKFEKEKPNFYKEAIVKVLKGEDVDEVIVDLSENCEKWGHTINGLRDIAKSQKKKIINPLRNINRYWEPCVFYVYGDNGTGKNRKHCRFDVKYDKTEIVGMYICITANGPIDNLYKKLRESNLSIDINILYRRIRFIIKFEGEPIDPRIGDGDILRIYEKGNKQDVNNRIFDIEFNRGTSLDEVKKVTLDLGIEGEIYQDKLTNLYYWRRIWNNKINEYSTIEDIDEITDRVITQIPKSTSDSSLSSNDSIQTRKRKKGKQVIKNNEVIKSDNIDIDLEQARIRSNYNELNNKKRKLDNFLETNKLLEDNNFDISESSSKEIKRIRNDQGLNRLLKKI
ncbi:10755_t:CDS:2, partial [Scutellospora calospora]